MPVPFHPGETLPKGLKRGEVLRLLATSEGNRQADLRARAILMVLIAYGLRASEVAGLRLDDLDWEEETLRVRRPMSGCTHHYPLSRGVGQAIVRYLTEVRPPRPERALFLTLISPIRPVTLQAVSNVVRTRLVPVCGQLADALKTYVARRAQRPFPKGTASTFLANRDGAPLVQRTAAHAFTKLLKEARIEGRNDGRRGPCFHSPASCRRRTPAGVLVPAGRRCPATTADAIHTDCPQHIPDFCHRLLFKAY